MMKTLKIIITGRVQKVGFRACIRRIASDLNITGTVLNLEDGKVQVYATGEAIVLEKFTSMVYSCPRAVIRDLQITEMPLTVFDGFSVLKLENRFNTEF
ncbi:acylphosphatase [Methanoregula formicica]|uniref:acylphosphatase n=1 Tax=Methanoregula formicica (strain DSM 22288 / NBRC 105244 / SMSP) TaxID=593750 RepID=L0HFH4_METFS|nr:acylphosphatase [Methanoregula formicica]AGB03492.1 acylphosphatase [Methanoregula formicica SMSP]